MDLANSVVFAVNGYRDLYDVLDDFLDDLLDRVRLVDVGDVLNGHNLHLDLGNGDVIGSRYGPLDDLLNGVRDRSVDNLLNSVGYSNLNRHRQLTGVGTATSC